MCTQRAHRDPGLNFLPQRRRQARDEQRLIPFRLVVILQELARPLLESGDPLQRLRQFPIGHSAHVHHDLAKPTNSVAVDAGPAPAEGETEALGEVDAEGESDGLADAEAETEGDTELLGESDVDADGEMDADGLIEVDIDGETEALGDRDGLADADADTDGDRDADTDADGDTLPNPVASTLRYCFTDPPTSTRCAVWPPLMAENDSRSDHVPAPPVSE